MSADGVVVDLRRQEPGEPAPHDASTAGPGSASAPRGTPESRLRRHLLGTRPSDRLWGWVGPLLVTLLAGVMRFWHLQHPHQLVFDETYYVKQAYTLWQNGFENQWPEEADKQFTIGNTDIYLSAGDRAVHPPVGKWMIASGEWLFGIDSSFGWRFGAAVIGTLMVLILARLVAEARAKGELAALGPWLGVRPLRLAAAVCLGLAVGVKWSGLYFAATLCLMSVLWDLGARRAAGVRSPWVAAVVRDGVPAALTMLPLMALTYLGTWTGWMTSDRGYYRTWAADNPSDAPVPGVLRSLWRYHADMLEFHTGLASDHPYESGPWAWLFQTRPTSFFYESLDRGEHGCTAEACSEAITSLGNPLVWWAGALSLVVLLACWLLRRDWRAGALLGAFAAGWLPWFLYPERTIYSFYAVAFEPYLVLGLTFVLGLVLGSRDAPRPRRTTGALVAGGFVVLVVLVSAFFWPVWTGETIPYQQWQLRMWLPSWV